MRPYEQAVEISLNSMTGWYSKRSRMRMSGDSQPIGWLGFRRSARLPCRLVSWRRCLRYRAQHSGNSHDIARRHRELEVLIDAPHPPAHRLADAPHGLAPAEV